jgi:stage II sporulation protein D
MGRLGRLICVASVAGVLLPLACTREHKPAPPPPGTPLVRVRILDKLNVLTLRATAAPTIRTKTAPRAVRVNLPPDADVAVTLADGSWKIGGVEIPGNGEMNVWQADDATLEINGRTFRGHFRFVPVGMTTFDVINVIDIDNYLKGVIARELLRDWNEDTYRAQAIVARTYALYEAKTAGGKRHFDVRNDQRSQVYGGIDDETSKSIESVEDTAGVVLAYGPTGHERIFKTYFSACCGGVTQSAADAFNEKYIVPLSDQNVQGLCSVAPRFNWGPVEISKPELTRRLQAYGAAKPERGTASMSPVARLEVQFVNRFNRPTHFIVIDSAGVRYSLTGEELRVAINSGANKDSPQRLNSSFVKVVNDPATDMIRFVEGHGHGHGVGLCQWCSEIRAEAGMRHEDIVLSAYPGAKLVRAY